MKITHSWLTVITENQLMIFLKGSQSRCIKWFDIIAYTLLKNLKDFDVPLLEFREVQYSFI